MSVKNKGFTLIEASIMLVVFGVVLLFAMAMITPVAKNAQAKQRAKKLDTAVRQFTSDLKANNSLPLPAANNLSPYGDSNFLYLTGYRAANGAPDINVCNYKDASDTQLTVNVCTDNSQANCGAISIDNVAFFVAHREVFTSDAQANGDVIVTVPEQGTTFNDEVQSLRSRTFYAMTHAEALTYLNCPGDPETGIITPREFPPVDQSKDMSTGQDIAFIALNGQSYYWCITSPNLFDHNVTLVGLAQNDTKTPNNCSKGGIYNIGIGLTWPAHGIPPGAYSVTIKIATDSAMKNIVDSMTRTLIITNIP